MTTVSRFNPNAVSQLKFGVRFQTQYSPNLSAQDLQDALSLRKLQDSEATRINTIPDQKDPFNVNVSIQPGQVCAEITTQHNGNFTVTRAEQTQPVSAFFNDLLANLEQLAPAQKTLEERKKETPQKGDELILSVFQAIQQNPEVKDTSSSGGLVHRYHIQSGAAGSNNADYVVNVTRINLPNSPKLTIGIIDNSASGKPTRLDLKMTTDNKILLDYDSATIPKSSISAQSHGDEAFNVLSRRLLELADVLEKKKSIHEVALTTMI